MLQQAFKMSWRDWRSGELRLMMFAVILAVTALCSVAFFADRLNTALIHNAHELIGGDVVIVSDQPLPPEFLDKANTLGLKSTFFANFSSMARSPDLMLNNQEVLGSMRLVNVKAVHDNYPLRGSLQVQTTLANPPLKLQNGPQQGEVWIAPELLSDLNINIGDQVILGEAAFPVTQLILTEPDGPGASISMAPRVLMHWNDLPATELIQPASRISYRFAVIGSSNTIQEFDTWATQRIEGDETTHLPMRGIRMERVQTGYPVMEQTLDRAQKFLQLLALLTTLLSGVAIIITAQNFARRRLDTCAMLKVFGVPQKHIVFLYFLELFIAGLIGGIIGVLSGYALHHIFVELLAELLWQELPQPSLWTAPYGIGIGLALLLSFGLPPVLQLSQVSPMRVLRKDIGKTKPLVLTVWFLGITAFIATLLLMGGNIFLAILTIGSFCLSLLLFAVLTLFIVKILKSTTRWKNLPLALRLAFRRMSSSPSLLVTQVSALSVGLLALLLLFLLRTDLINSWQDLAPEDAPNRFVINIMQDQADTFEQTLHQASVTEYDWYPMLLGRLVKINDTPVNTALYKTDQERRLIDREFSLSHMNQYPQYNKIIEGQWTENEVNAISVEAGLMKTLGLHLGDKLTFSVGGNEYSGQITSVRELEWFSMHVNFFVIFPLQNFEEDSKTYITAFNAPPNLNFDNQLAQAFPNITVINLSTILSKIQSTLDQVIKAIEFIFIFTLLAGIVLLYATISSTREQWLKDFGVMRALGASNQLLKTIQHIELMGTGVIAGFLSAFVALLVSGALIVFVFGLEWHPTLWIMLIGSITGLSLAWFTGWLSLRSILKQPVLGILRNSA